jgi:putative transposase
MNNQTEYRTMTRKHSNSTLKEIKRMIAEDGEFLRPMVRAVIQEFLEAEMAEAVGAEKGERVQGRLSYRSGYYTRSLVTRVGKLELRVPQDRNGRFSTEIFERYQRSEKAPVAALTQMYIQGSRPGKSKQSVKSSADTVLARARSVRSIRSSMPSWAALLGASSRASIPI